jgi:HEPN domain-containing protein
MKTREDNPQDWFMLAADRLRGADILYAAEGVTFLGVEALHEAVERYLKGFLVSRGWKIEHTHDLSYLIDRAIKHDETFRDYIEPAFRETKENSLQIHMIFTDLSLWKSA